MTIEISRGKLTYQHRINPYSPTCIDRRENKHGSRWRHWSHHPTSWAAIEALLKMGRKEKQEEDHERI